MRPKIEPKPIEKPVSSDKFLVSKTGTKGIITYANPIFIEIFCICKKHGERWQLLLGV
jgi:hypothetical protein